MRLARYLSTRIDRDTQKEDVQLTIWSCEAAKSSGFDGILLSDLEYGVRSFHDRLRELLPVMDRASEPAAGTVQRTNDEMLMRSEEHTSELQSLMRISYAVFCLKKKKRHYTATQITIITMEYTARKTEQLNTNIKHTTFSTKPTPS